MFKAKRLFGWPLGIERWRLLIRRIEDALRPKAQNHSAEVIGE